MSRTVTPNRHVDVTSTASKRQEAKSSVADGNVTPRSSRLPRADSSHESVGPIPAQALNRKKTLLIWHVNMNNNTSILHSFTRRIKKTTNEIGCCGTQQILWYRYREEFTGGLTTLSMRYREYMHILALQNHRGRSRVVITCKVVFLGQCLNIVQESASNSKICAAFFTREAIEQQRPTVNTVVRWSGPESKLCNDRNIATTKIGDMWSTENDQYRCIVAWEQQKGTSTNQIATSTSTDWLRVDCKWHPAQNEKAASQ